MPEKDAVKYMTTKRLKPKARAMLSKAVVLLRKQEPGTTAHMWANSVWNKNVSSCGKEVLEEEEPNRSSEWYRQNSLYNTGALRSLLLLLTCSQPH